MEPPDIDPYKVLQVDPEAEDEVIQAAYRRLAQKYHPDRSPAGEAADRMVAINAAWELVRDPARRKAYDRERQGRAAASGAAATSAGQGASAPGARDTVPGDRPAAAGGHGTPGGRRSDAPGGAAERPPETVSSDWTSGRSGAGGGYDASTMRAPEGLGAAGPPPGNPSGSVMNFGRYAGWSLGEIARADIDYIEWLDRMPIGRSYRDEIDPILRKAGRRRSAASEASERHGLFRRR